jgi:ABC-type proline/glycine betaine transport system permease subunit
MNALTTGRLIQAGLEIVAIGIVASRLTRTIVHATRSASDLVMPQFDDL